jgi:hypothetical protein
MGNMVKTAVQSVDLVNVRTQLAAGEKATLETPSESRKRKRLQEKCCCSDDSAMEVVLALNSGSKEMDPMGVFAKVMETGVEVLCWRHLRMFAGDAVGLLNSGMENKELRDRLRRVYGSQQDLDSFKRDDQHWFRKSSDVRRTNLGRFPAIPPPPFKLNAPAIFARFAGENSWETWQKDGTIHVKKLAGYLEDEMDSIETEFDMYRHHVRIDPSNPSTGFLRHMYYSLFQQVLRMDPVIYALTVAGRPDHNPCLISYPNIVESHHTASLHTDTNVVQLVEDRVGCSNITTSISLDDEDEKGCTVVVKGIQHRLDQWVQKMETDGTPLLKNSRTSSLGKDYLPEHWDTYGEPVPIPCERFDFTMSLPEILRGDLYPHTVSYLYWLPRHSCPSAFSGFDNHPRQEIGGSPFVGLEFSHESRTSLQFHLHLCRDHQPR